MDISKVPKPYTKQEALKARPKTPIGTFIAYKIAVLLGMDVAIRFKEEIDKHRTDVHNWLKQAFPELSEPHHKRMKETLEKQVISEFKDISERRVKALYENIEFFGKHDLTDIEHHFDKDSVSNFLAGKTIISPETKKQFENAQENKKILNFVFQYLPDEIKRDFANQFSEYFSGTKLISPELKEKLKSFTNTLLLNKNNFPFEVQKKVYNQVSAFLTDATPVKDFSVLLEQTTENINKDLKEKTDKVYQEIIEKQSKINTIKEFINNKIPELESFSNSLCTTNDIIKKNKDDKFIIDIKKDALKLNDLNEINQKLDERIKNIESVITEDHLKTINTINELEKTLIESNYTESTAKQVTDELKKTLTTKTDSNKLKEFNEDLGKLKKHLNASNKLQKESKNVDENISFANSLDPAAVAKGKDGKEKTAKEFLEELQKLKGAYTSEIKRFNTAIDGLLIIHVPGVKLEKKLPPSEPIQEKVSQEEPNFMKATTDLFAQSIDFLARAKTDLTNLATKTYESIVEPKAQSTTERQNELPLIQHLTNRYLDGSISSPSKTYDDFKENIKTYNNLLKEAESFNIDVPNYSKITITDINEIETITARITYLTEAIKNRRDNIQLQEKYTELYKKLPPELTRDNPATPPLDSFMKQVKKENFPIDEINKMLQVGIRALEHQLEETEQAQQREELKREKTIYDKKLVEFQEAGFSGISFEEATQNINDIVDIKNKITASITNMDELLKSLNFEKAKNEQLFSDLQDLKAYIPEEYVFESFDDFRFASLKKKSIADKLIGQGYTNEMYLESVQVSNQHLGKVLEKARTARLQAVKSTISSAVSKTTEAVTSSISSAISTTKDTLDSLRGMIESPERKPLTKEEKKKELDELYKNLNTRYEKALAHAQKAKIQPKYADFKSIKNAYRQESKANQAHRTSEGLTSFVNQEIASINKAVKQTKTKK